MGPEAAVGAAEPRAGLGLGVGEVREVEDGVDVAAVGAQGRGDGVGVEGLAEVEVVVGAVEGRGPLRRRVRGGDVAEGDAGLGPNYFEAPSGRRLSDPSRRLSSHRRQVRGPSGRVALCLLSPVPKSSSTLRTVPERRRGRVYACARARVVKIQAQLSSRSALQHGS